MARDSEFQRERKKKQLRQSMVTNDKVRSAPVSWAEDHKRTVNVAGIVVAVLVLAVVLAWFVAERLGVTKHMTSAGELMCRMRHLQDTYHMETALL